MSYHELICQRCGRTPSVGFNVPHSQYRTKRFFKVNVQKVTADGQTLWLCTQCIKGATNRPARHPQPVRT